MLQFESIMQFFDTFKDDETCKAFLEKQRWGGTPACPHCGSIKVYRTARGFKCSERECAKKFTVTVGTVFESSKISLRTWFAAMYLITMHKKGISSHSLSDILGITQKTAWFILHRIREALKAKNSPLLTGEVQADETFVGGKNKNRHVDKKVKNSQGRSWRDKVPVVGLLGEGGEVRTFVVPDTKAETLHPIIHANVDKSATLVTDEWPGYRRLNKHYEHVVIDHGKKQYARDGYTTNSIESFWAEFKRSIIGCYHSVSPQHLFRYCNEFEHRHNHRNIAGNERFGLTLQGVDGRLKYKDLIGKSHGKGKNTQEGKKATGREIRGQA